MNAPTILLFCGKQRCLKQQPRQHHIDQMPPPRPSSRGSCTIRLKGNYKMLYLAVQIAEGFFELCVPEFKSFGKDEGIVCFQALCDQACHLS